MDSHGKTNDAKQVSSVSYVYAENSEKVIIDSEVWKTWGNFYGHLEYYLYCAKSGLLWHYGLCVRQPGTNNVLRIDLSVCIPSSQWYVRVVKSEWRPTNEEIKRSRHDWHAAAILRAAKLFGEKFSYWHILLNNCGHWSNGIVRYMQDDENYKKVQCEQVGNLEEFLELAVKLGMDVNVKTFPKRT